MEIRNLTLKGQPFHFLGEEAEAQEMTGLDPCHMGLRGRVGRDGELGF